MEPDKADLHRLVQGSYSILFNAIDKSHSKYIDFNSLNNFFNSIGIYPYEEEIISFLRRLDKDDDGRITLEEFCNGLMPRLDSIPIQKPINNNPISINRPISKSPNKKVISNNPIYSPNDKTQAKKLGSNSPNKKPAKIIKKKYESPGVKHISNSKSIYKTDTKIDYYPSPVTNSPFSKKFTQYEKLKKQIENELENSKKRYVNRN